MYVDPLGLKFFSNLWQWIKNHIRLGGGGNTNNKGTSSNGFIYYSSCPSTNGLPFNPFDRNPPMPGSDPTKEWRRDHPRDRSQIWGPSPPSP